jgi:hypothetical protein
VPSLDFLLMVVSNMRLIIRRKNLIGLLVHKRPIVAATA